MRVYLIGFSASGKSTVGRLLAKRMKRRFMDVDSRIERQTGMKIPEIFRKQGERAFRKMEQSVVSKIYHSSDRNLVIALGGGAFQNPLIRKMVREDGVTVYLSCSAREIYRRLRLASNRPMLEVKPRAGETLARARKRCIHNLLQRRRANYLRADLKVSTTSKSPSEAVGELQRVIRRYYARH